MYRFYGGTYSMFCVLVVAKSHCLFLVYPHPNHFHNFDLLFSRNLTLHLPHSRPASRNISKTTTAPRQHASATPKATTLHCQNHAYISSFAFCNDSDVLHKCHTTLRSEREEDRRKGGNRKHSTFTGLGFPVLDWPRLQTRGSVFC